MICILDWCTGGVLALLHRQTLEGDFGGCVNLTLKQRNDLVIFGSSRAESHYDPEIIAKETGFSVFNAGVAAQHLLFHFCLEQMVFDQYLPKAIILDFNVRDLWKRKEREPYERLAVLLPFYKDGNPRVREILTKRSPFEPVKLLSSVYPYNSQVLPILKYLVSPHAEGTSLHAGYKPYHGSEILRIEQSLKTVQTKSIATGAPGEVDETFKKVLFDFVGIARSHNVKVIVCQGPLWHIKDCEDPREEKLTQAYKEILAELQVPLVEITQATDPQFKDPSLFKDRIHLNDKGAQVFSDILGHRLKAEGLLEDTLAKRPNSLHGMEEDR